MINKFRKMIIMNFKNNFLTIKTYKKMKLFNNLKKKLSHQKFLINMKQAKFYKIIVMML